MLSTPCANVEHELTQFIAVNFAAGKGVGSHHSARRGGGGGSNEGGNGGEEEGGGAGGNGGGMPATPPKVREVMSKIDSFLEQRSAQRVLRDEHRLCVGLRV
jgi:hypothetical protein